MCVCVNIHMYTLFYVQLRATDKLPRPWSQQARQLTPRRAPVAHLRNRVGVFTFTRGIYMGLTCQCNAIASAAAKARRVQSAGVPEKL